MFLFFLIISAFSMGLFASYIFLHRKITLVKKRLYTDKLTGLKNSNYLEDHFSQFLSSSNSYVLIDIDNFKDFNTQFGYEVADKILQGFARVMRKSSGIDEILRYKFGDEFLIVFRNKSSRDALLFLSELRNKLDTHPFKIDKGVFQVYFSAGITTYRKDSSQESIICKLMEALSIAKEKKNCYIVSDQIN
jgi:diguanylate cyclase (GGDEF)-like protein